MVVHIFRRISENNYANFSSYRLKDLEVNRKHIQTDILFSIRSDAKVMNGFKLFVFVYFPFLEYQTWNFFITRNNISWMTAVLTNSLLGYFYSIFLNVKMNSLDSFNILVSSDWLWSTTSRKVNYWSLLLKTCNQSPKHSLRRRYSDIKITTTNVLC